MKEVVIVGAARTPVGSFGGALSGVSAVALGTAAAREAIRRSGVPAHHIDEAVIGNILSAGLGQNIARQIALHSGMSDSSTAVGINMLCGSGLRAVIQAVQTLRAGDADFILAGGTESMSRAPYLLTDYRWGKRMGEGQIEDSMIMDALTDAFSHVHMGVTAENIAEQWHISREEQDAFALNSQLKAEKAQLLGYFDEEIVPVEVTVKKKKSEVRQDEHPRHGMTLETLSGLRPVFRKNGTVTVGNASGLNDGAAMLVLTTRQKAREAGLTVLASIRSYASAGLDPQIMGYGPVPAVKKALHQANLDIGAIDLAEINEAFAAQSIAVIRDLKLDPDKVNVSGGAIALGHPVGASGARILCTLLYGMKRTGAKTGLAALCIGGGQGTAVIVNNEVPD
ncbi:acetyl-CoA C-acetyltransferase [Sporolactobacillus vineae]|uniref:acetyl-CoA C-acetyltransferase n=1 Tax=Sporolactobacillus vineae TaxID=444463 RepID=UPI0002889228|nr:acetyl-CoA C-acetyltransferase [Sporolactobacillus vineae]